MIRRILGAAVTIAVALGMYAADPAGARPAGWRAEECRYAMSDGERGFSVGDVKRTLRCAAERWEPAGGIERAFDVVSCESGFRARAQNPGSSAAGVWQVVSSTWDSWLERFDGLVERWDLSRKVLNGRTNAILGTRVARSGYGPWSGGVCA